MNIIEPMANSEALKANLDKKGEAMIRLDAGERIELRIHNVNSRIPPEK
jgi:hypothetical protein